MNIYEIIATKIDDMSKSQKKIALYILNNKAQAAFLNVNNLAKAAQVSEATIIRFALFLGYKGYPQLQKELQAQLQKTLSMRDRLDISSNTYQGKDDGLHKIFEDEIVRLRQTEQALDSDMFLKAAQAIQKAKHIYVVAGLSAVSLGHFMQYYLNMMRGNVSLIGHESDYAESFCSLTKDDLVIGLTFSRYTKRTCELVEFAHTQGVLTFCITDTMASPVIKNSTYYLLCESAMPTYIDSFVAPLTIINALLTYIGKEYNRTDAARIGKLEKLWDQFDIFL